MKSIPVEKIDALIASLQQKIKPAGIESTYRDEIELLEDLKKESEKMIPLSTIIPLIDSALEWLHNSKYNTAVSVFSAMDDLEKLKELTKDKDPS